MHTGDEKRSVIALVGKIGHGKTFILNKVAGTRHLSHMGAGSVTRTLQFGECKDSGIMVVDTPGFYASDDIATHIAAQKIALEGTFISGIYIVAKFARADEIAETANKIMKFIGAEDVRIILTHADCHENDNGYDELGTKARLKDLLGVEKILIAGKRTPRYLIDQFMAESLHEPREFRISEEQISVVSSLCVASRKMNRKIDQVYDKIEAASTACRELVKNGIAKTRKSDDLIVKTQNITASMVKASKEEIFRQAEDYDSDEQKNIVYGRAGFALSLRLKEFMDATNKCLSWDVTDTSDSRNDYRQCPHCNAIFNKTEGCDGQTVCGALPHAVRNKHENYDADFRENGSKWHMWYFWHGKWYRAEQIITLFDSLSDSTSTYGGGNIHIKNARAIIESGCGAPISWSQMRPVDPSLLKPLADVELQSRGAEEDKSKTSFENRLKTKENDNKKLFQEALKSFV
mmetsp:Transcript_24787/g.68592  ORF Transcript_24787/g.68592 Transcript_24787/m.68592 type:complete len:462 (+) Transcript_24787:1938-3323(+)